MRMGKYKNIILITTEGVGRSMSARRDEIPKIDDPATEGDGGAQEAVAFIAETVMQLMAICERHKLHTVGQILAMAHLEAREFEHRRYRGTR